MFARVSFTSLQRENAHLHRELFFRKRLCTSGLSERQKNMPERKSPFPNGHIKKSEKCTIHIASISSLLNYLLTYLKTIHFVTHSTSMSHFGLHTHACTTRCGTEGKRSLR